jgi:hypothetical protein
VIRELRSEDLPKIMFMSGSVAPAQTEATNETKRKILSREVEYEKIR